VRAHRPRVPIVALAAALACGAAGCQSCLDEPSQGQAPSTAPTVGPVKIRPGLVRSPLPVAASDGGDPDALPAATPAPATPPAAAADASGR